MRETEREARMGVEDVSEVRIRCRMRKEKRKEKKVSGCARCLLCTETLPLVQL